MELKKITKEEFNNFEVVDGFKQCPTGDYSGISFFTEMCSFGDESVFGYLTNFTLPCRFGKTCVFGGDSTFSGGCIFSENCYLDEGNTFGAGCWFCDWCDFSGNCSFSTGCWFGNGCSFGTGNEFMSETTFSKNCSFRNENSFTNDVFFGDGCTINDHVILRCVLMSGLLKPMVTTYFSHCEDGIFVQHGHFFGSLKEFVGKSEDDFKNADVYKKTADLVEHIFLKDTEKIIIKYGETTYENVENLVNFWKDNAKDEMAELYDVNNKYDFERIAEILIDELVLQHGNSGVIGSNDFEMNKLETKSGNPELFTYTYECEWDEENEEVISDRYIF